MSCCRSGPATAALPDLQQCTAQSMQTPFPSSARRLLRKPAFRCPPGSAQLLCWICSDSHFYQLSHMQRTLPEAIFGFYVYGSGGTDRCQCSKQVRKRANARFTHWAHHLLPCSSRAWRHTCRTGWCALLGPRSTQTAAPHGPRWGSPRPVSLCTASKLDISPRHLQMGLLNTHSQTMSLAQPQEIITIAAKELYNTVERPRTLPLWADGLRNPLCILSATASHLQVHNASTTCRRVVHQMSDEAEWILHI